MSKQEVRVGQVWRLRHGVEIHVDAVDATRVLWTSIDHTVAGSYYLALFSRHTLVQDAPETVDWTAGGRWKPEADCCEMLTAEDVCCGACPDCQPIKNALPEDRVPFQKDACSALRETLPKSEHFTQSRLEHIGMDGELAVAASCAADLRRKVSSLRSWPVCPVSKQAYNIRAEGLSDSRNSETLRTWIAQFCCETCK